MSSGNAGSPGAKRERERDLALDPQRRGEAARSGPPRNAPTSRCWSATCSSVSSSAPASLAASRTARRPEAAAPSASDWRSSSRWAIVPRRSAASPYLGGITSRRSQASRRGRRRTRSRYQRYPQRA